jgi:RNA polymerase sigma-70 factor, ECF subfamily
VIKGWPLPACIGTETDMEDAFREQRLLGVEGVEGVEPADARGGRSEGTDLGAGVRAAIAADRVRSIVRAHYSFLWRSLRRLGVPEASVEDAAQKVLLVVAKRIDDIAPGREKAFLFGVALRIERTMRRESSARREVVDEDLLASLPSRGSDAGEQLDERRARALLDGLLEGLPLDLRTVFVLYELEEMTMAEIASMLDLPSGTVASRLRRAREAFDALSRRVQARLARTGDER